MYKDYFYYSQDEYSHDYDYDEYMPSRYVEDDEYIQIESIDRDLSDESLSSIEEYLITSIHYGYDYVKKAVYQLERRCSPPSDWPMSALVISCGENYKDIVEFLVEKGMKLNDKCLERAVSMDCREVVEYILSCSFNKKVDPSKDDYILFRNMNIETRALYEAWVNHPFFYKKDEALPFSVQQKIDTIEEKLYGKVKKAKGRA